MAPSPTQRECSQATDSPAYLPTCRLACPIVFGKAVFHVLVFFWNSILTKDVRNSELLPYHLIPATEHSELRSTNKEAADSIVVQLLRCTPAIGAVIKTIDNIVPSTDLSPPIATTHSTIGNAALTKKMTVHPTAVNHPPVANLPLPKLVSALEHQANHQLGSRHKTSSRSPPPSRKKSRFDEHEPLPLCPRSAVSPPPSSDDVARLFSILKEDSGRRLPQSITSSAPERQERGKLSSGAMREHEPHQGSFERQYRPQSNAPATFRAGVRPSVSSEFNLPFSISTERLRTRYLPSAIEVSERGADSAYYTHGKKIAETGKDGVSMNDLEDASSKIDTRTANGTYGFTLPRQASLAMRRTPPVFGVPFGSSSERL